MIYTGIGARKTPCNILNAMVQIGTYMAKEGHILRSGGAQGADRAFEIGCDFKRIGTKEIFLPWRHFEKHTSPFFTISHQAMSIAANFHPAWDKLSSAAQKFMGRNSYQILGHNLETPSNFIICWTLGGKTVGGTGQSIRMAKHFNIPVFNLGDTPLRAVNDRLEAFLGENQ